MATALLARIGGSRQKGTKNACTNGTYEAQPYLIRTRGTNDT
jgi:hypothetical protein